MIVEFSDRDIGEQSRPGIAALDRQGRHPARYCRIAIPANHTLFDTADNINRRLDVRQDLDHHVAALRNDVPPQVGQCRGRRLFSYERAQSNELVLLSGGAFSILANLPVVHFARQQYTPDVPIKYGFYPVSPGAELHAGHRQSIPSPSMECCACVRCATPSFAIRHGKYPSFKIL